MNLFICLYQLNYKFLLFLTSDQNNLPKLTSTYNKEDETSLNLQI